MAAELVEQIAMEVNEKVMKMDQSQAVITASVRLNGTAPDLIQPNRRLILEDVIKMQHDRKLRNRKVKKYVLLLFNDIILLAKTGKGDTYHHINGRKMKKIAMKYKWKMKQINVTGITSPFDASNGWPFYIMKSVSVEQNSGQKFGTAVERIKLYAETEASRKAIVEIIEECK